MMNNIIGPLIITALAFAFGIYALIKLLNKHKLIDTESIAVVTEVTDLGRSDGRKVFAIKYDVKCSTPFHIYETPCKKERRIGTERVIFFQKDDPKNNYYFKTIGQFDKRLIMPCAVILCGVILTITIIVSMF